MINNILVKKIVKKFITFTFAFLIIFTFASIFNTANAVNIKYQFTSDKNEIFFRVYANLYGKPQHDIKVWTYPRGIVEGMVMGDFHGDLNYTYNEYAMRFDEVNTINTNYRWYDPAEKRYAVYYDKFSEAKGNVISVNEPTVFGIDQYISTYFEPYSDPVIVSFGVPALNDGSYGPNRADLYSGMPSNNPLCILQNEVYVTRYQYPDEHTKVTEYKITKEGVEKLKKAIGSRRQLRMSLVSETYWDASRHKGILTGEYGDSQYSSRASGGMDAGWKAMAGMQGFGVDANGSVFGSAINGTYIKGKSVLNTYDNLVNLNLNNQRKVLIRYADTSGSTWQTIEGAEGNNINTLDNNVLSNELKNLDNSGDSSYYREALKAEGFREKYTYSGTQGLQVKFSDNVKYDSKTRIATIYNAKTKKYETYKYNGYYKYWGRTYDTTKLVEHNTTATGFNIAAADQTDYTKIVYDFSKVSNDSKKREVYVNYIEEGSMKLLHSIKNDSQNGLPNQISGSEGSGTYAEYYKFPINTQMTIQNSNKISGNQVTIDGKKYEYTFMRTSSGFNLDAAWKNGGDKVPPQYGLMSYTIPQKSEIDTTIVSFYFKQVEDKNITEDIKIKGRLAFKTDGNINKQTCESDGGIEYVPTDEKLQPYIEGAQRYLIPNVSDETGTNLTSKNSYRQDYETFYYFKITGVSKANRGCSSPFYNNYETTSMNNNSNVNSWMEESNSRTQPFHESMSFSISNGGLSDPININFSDYKNRSGNEWSYTVSGSEMGAVWIPPVPPGPDGKGGAPGYCDSQSVSVKYNITVKRVYKLNTLPIYKIVSNATRLNKISGAGDNTKVFDGGSVLQINTSGYYDNKLVEHLRTYFEDYNPAKRDIPTGSKALTVPEDFSSIYGIPGTKHNGIRDATADIQYELYDYARKVKITDSANLPTGVSKVASGKLPILNKGYYNNGEDPKNTEPRNERVNILTPIELDTPDIISENVVDHIDGTGNNVIQKDSPFTLTPKTKNSHVYSNLATEKFVRCYYVKFDFDVSDLKVRKTNSKDGAVEKDYGKVLKNTYVRVPRGGCITGVSSTGNISDIIGQFKNKVRIVAIATNTRSSFEYDQIALEQGFSEKYATDYNNEAGYNGVYMDSQGTQLRDNGCDEDDGKTYNGKESTDTGMTRDARYIVFNDYDTFNIGRIYDFKITDCSDVNFKNVFRTYKDNVVNQLTGKYYYSGIRKLVLGQFNNTNILDDRTDIGNTPQTILPLGPYKNTDASYIQAPKVGYRISYDVKTTGYFGETANNKHIEIKPSYYYISKDGKTYNDKIELYYKNNDGKYTKYLNRGYNIQYKPNDGYRTKPNEYLTNELSYMATKYLSLPISASMFKLERNMMATTADRFVQCWYGEFKLPNSTIVVKEGQTDLNADRLTDGYIGVKFDIVAVEVDGANTRRTSYNKPDANGKGKNTTQWDYEGYLGYKGNGSDVSIPDRLKIQLEKGIWQIDSQEKYEKVRGTVVLFDIDNRAASDFE